MAVRLNPRTAEAVRQRIQITQLVNRLQNHVLKKVQMSPTQLDAAKFLINKRMPNPPEDKNLKVEGSLTVEIVKFANDTAAG